MTLSLILERFGYEPGYYKNDKFVRVPEMIPEFIVPNLSEFKASIPGQYRSTPSKIDKKSNVIRFFSSF